MRIRRIRQKIIFCFNAEFGAVPAAVKNEMIALKIELQSWPWKGGRQR
jgi:hypothetical protein